MNLPRNAQIWAPGYLRNRLEARCRKPARRAWLAITDHFEPLWHSADDETGSRRVAGWEREWPRIASEFADSAGRQPVYTFFYPEEEYRPSYLDALAAMAARKIGDVEVHLHHNGEGEQNFVDRIGGFTETLASRHGLLRKTGAGIAFGFIHGDWALDNSHPQGLACGLNNELTLLKRLGCYADFTLPSAPHATQTRIVNTVYWAVDDPERPKSHDTGIPVRLRRQAPPSALLMIPGPLGIRSRLLGSERRLLPRLEKGELAGNDMPTPARARLWLSLAPRIGDDVFIKLYTHGTQEANSAALLSSGLRNAIRWTAEACAEAGMELYFASAWQFKLAIDALIGDGDPVEAAVGSNRNNAPVSGGVSQ